ncbi:50S ribosomal protein L18e [Candidatus Methanobinarius endosymbioticus]|uniref:Large ribosomal subunit protein eL18 n=1 Tax=Candidatus Methanobinarius endosymbioticus TaxID=2006182 RepID=A0A366MAJ6_9EURY|nr:50S ribosomal protein L18e [Candidatus Methanobinarius endosymbioticus]
MARKIIKTNPNLIELIGNLKDKSYNEEVAIWKDVASRLEKSTRRRTEINLSDINRVSEEEQTIIVPGKVLANGNLDHKVTVAALNFSKTAQEKIEEAGGEGISISEIIEKNPKGSNIKIVE